MARLRDVEDHRARVRYMLRPVKKGPMGPVFLSGSNLGLFVTGGLTAPTGSHIGVFVIQFRIKVTQLVASRADRYETSDDDILLQPAQVIGLALDGGVRQYLGRLLEARRREETLGAQARLGYAQQDRLGFRQCFLRFFKRLGDELEPVAFNEVALKEFGIS